MTNQRVLLTGVTGFIGTHLKQYLDREGYEVHALVRRPLKNANFSWYVCNLSNQKAVSEIFEAVQPQYLIHLASQATPGRNLEDFDTQLENTIIPTLTLAKAAPKSLKLALFVGSCEEYGDGPSPFYEDQALRSFSPYGWGKISAYYGASTIASQRGLNWCWIRPFLTFGKGQEPNYLIPSVIRDCLNDREVCLSPGGQTRDLIWIEDHIGMIGRILENPETARGQVVNLCSGEPKTVRFIAETIQKIIGKGILNFGAFPYRENEAMSFYGSRLKFETLFGKYQIAPFESAMVSTIESYLKK